MDIVPTYYEQRSSTPGTLLITEATFISKEQSGYNNAPGIYNEEQIAAWRKVTNAVHAKGSFIYLQLWALGRVADKKFAEENGITITGASAIPVNKDYPTPTPLTEEQIKSTIGDYAQAAKNAISAGFDGVEIHGANGYLVDQFIQSNSNQRTDAYGGSIENRSRFAIEVTQAVVDAVGASKTAIRLSPWSTFQGMKMDDPIPQFTDVIEKLNKFNLAYLHIVESRIEGNADVEGSGSLDFAFNTWKGPFLVAGGFQPESAKKLVEDRNDKDIVVVFGRLFISTPDLPFRIKAGIPLTKYDRNLFYNAKSPIGYIDYKFSDEYQKSAPIKVSA
jgi:NADPH2 dehydrogenase